ncbi:glycosyltransferase family 4 protein [Desulfovibrio piger]|uniref:Glycosyltransferase family 4 protein n=1 Tax=Desulfovibrio piger TaxID=901 RepID=A0A848CBV8_9BACT|nr:glycosyltransferase family 4 protein [Desulfovibrio piger]NME52722.1 glycosyltransferase family 4 protein [Desulfovibrio piger]
MKKKYKIAIISQSCPPLGGGGVDSSHYNLCLVLHNLGYPVAFFTIADSKKSCPEDLLFVHRFCVPYILKKIIILLCKIYFRILSPKKMQYQVQDILLCQWGSLLARFSLKKFNPDILVIPDRGCPGLSIRKIRHEKTVLICHHNPARFTSPLLFDREISQADIRQAVNIEKYAARFVDSIICPSQYMADFSKKSHGYKQDIHVIPNIIDTNIIDSIPKKKIPNICNDEESIVIYIPSGGTAIKGGRYLFEIVRRLCKFNNNIFFYISGEISAPLQYEFKETGLDRNIYSPGSIQYHENIAYMKSCSICISPALLENFSMALFEAQYCGLPSICFDCGGNRELIVNNATGCIVPQLDIDLIIEKTIQIISDKYILRIFSENSRRHACDFLKKTGIEKYIKLFDSLLQEKNK